MAAGLACPAAPAVAEPLPKLEILTEAPPPSHRAPPAGTTLVANSLSEGQREGLATALRALLAEQSRRSNPFYVPLDEGRERALAQELLADKGPMFTAAAALAAGGWQSAEGDLFLRPVFRCRAGARCLPALGADPNGDLGNRARFLAWPLGYAILLRAGSVTEAARVANLVRERGLAPDVALVLTGAELHRLRPSPALREVAAVARVLLHKQAGLALAEAFAERLRSLAAIDAAGDELPWLKLGKNTVLIVPRLGSLANADRFTAEVRDGLGTVQVEWLAAPPVSR